MCLSGRGAGNGAIRRSGRPGRSAARQTHRSPTWITCLTRRGSRRTSRAKRRTSSWTSPMQAITVGAAMPARAGCRAPRRGPPPTPPARTGRRLRPAGRRSTAPARPARTPHQLVTRADDLLAAGLRRQARLEAAHVGRGYLSQAPEARVHAAIMVREAPWAPTPVDRRSALRRAALTDREPGVRSAAARPGTSSPNARR